MAATLSMTLKADSSLTENGLNDEFWVGWSGEECVEDLTATSPFDSSTSEAIASAKVKPSGSCAFDNSNVEIDFYLDPAKTTKVGYAKFREVSGSEDWDKNGQSNNPYYPTDGSYGYSLAVKGSPNSYTITIEAVPPES